MTPPSTRERIAAAAGALFYGQGLRAVSMDAVAEAAGVTKRTLYYHFRSKDDLITAYLETTADPTFTLIRRGFEQAQGDVADKVEGLFLALAGAARRPGWRGCGILRASVELIETPGHPALLAGRAHKQRIEDWLCEVLQQADMPGPEARPLARQIVLLFDGALAVALLQRDPAYMEAAGRAAHSLVRLALRD